MPDIALVTAKQAIDLDDDLPPLEAALAAHGATPSVVCWDDPAVEWREFDAAVLRSAWDYPERLAEFIEWARSVDGETRLLNPIGILEWNADKRYLSDLADAGVPAVPTVFAAPGEEIAWPHGCDVVVKPSVSAGSRGTARFAEDDLDSATSLVEAIWSSGRTAMIQPYLDTVDVSGELGIVAFDGRYSHSFRKGPLLHRGADPTPDLFAVEEITPADAPVEARRVAQAAIEAVGGVAGAQPVYARVDLIHGADGPLVLELELIEPSMFHHADPKSAGRFAAAILGRITD